MRASAVALLTLAACGARAPLGATCAGDGSAVLRTSRAEVSVAAGAFALRVTSVDGDVLLETAGGPATTSVAPREEWREVGEEAPWVEATEVTSTTRGQGTIRVVLTRAGDDEPVGTVEVSAGDVGGRRRDARRRAGATIRRGGEATRWGSRNSWGSCAAPSGGACSRTR